MLKYHRTSILTSTAQTVVNTVNTVGVMGKGIAAAFKARYPEMFRSYQKLCRDEKIQIGVLWLWKAQDQWVLNFPTKRHWRHPSKLEYIEAGLLKFVAEYERRGITEISFPRLGCGNGGLDWADVRPLMESYLAQLPIQVYIHDFEKDIGLPEHKEKQAFRFERSFEKFLAQIEQVVENSHGKFHTITKKSPFGVKWTTDRNLQILREDKSGLVSVDELYELWSMLLRGPVTQHRLPGTSRNWAYYIFAILAKLPYIRPIIIGHRHEASILAIELTDQSRIQTLPSSADQQGEIVWA